MGTLIFDFVSLLLMCDAGQIGLRKCFSLRTAVIWDLQMNHTKYGKHEWKRLHIFWRQHLCYEMLAWRISTWGTLAAHMPNVIVKPVPLVKADVTLHELDYSWLVSCDCPGMSWDSNIYNNDKPYCSKSVLFSRVTLIVVFVFYVFKKDCLLYETLLNF